MEYTAAEDGHTQHTWWLGGDHKIAACNSGKRLAVYNLTPEQAIAATLGGMKMYAVKTWTDLDDIGESYIERKLYRSKEDAERRAEEVEAESSDFRYYASVVEFEVVEP